MTVAYASKLASSDVGYIDYSDRSQIVYNFMVYSTRFSYGVAGVGEVVTTYFMRAWDSANLRYCFWTTLAPSEVPVLTQPSSLPTNLTSFAIVSLHT